MNTIIDANKVIRNFAEKHGKIKHRKEEPHYVALLNDGLTLKIRNAVYTPLVALQNMSVGYSDSVANLSKKRNMRILIVDKISDAGDFESIENVKYEMEQVADDLLKYLHSNKQKLGIITIEDAILDYTEETNLTGVILEITVQIKADACPNEVIRYE